MITLRSLTEADRERLLEWRNLDDVRRWMYTDHQITREEHDHWFDKVLVDQSRRYWVIHSDEAPVGTVSLADILSQGRSAQLGLYVADARSRGAGTGAGAMFLVLDHAFSELGLRAVEAECLAANEMAVRLYERSGLSRCETVRRTDRHLEVIRLAISRDGWLSRRMDMKKELIDRGVLA